MTDRQHLLAARRQLRIAREALQRIRDYDVAPHLIARDALDKMNEHDLAGEAER